MLLCLPALAIRLFSLIFKVKPSLIKHIAQVVYSFMVIQLLTYLQLASSPIIACFVKRNRLLLSQILDPLTARLPNLY